MRAYLAITKIDLKLALRNRAVIFFNYLFPLIFFFGFGQLLDAGRGGGVVQLVTMVLVLGVLGNGLFGAGMRAVSEREMNILRRFKVAPITPLPLLVAAMVTGWLTFVPLVLLVLLLAKFMYGMAVPQEWPSLLALVSLGIVAFRSIGLIVASVVNSLQEANIVIQILYLPMMFISGATFPVWMLPPWMQALAQFLPASYLARAIQGVLLRDESLLDHGPAIASMLVTTALSTFVSVQLFRWEKEEKIPNRAKAWLLAALIPFVLLGFYQNLSSRHLDDARMLAREVRRSGTMVIRGARVVTGAGKVIEAGGVVLRNGRIVQVFEGAGPAVDTSVAVVIEASGKTLLPGLIDAGASLALGGGAPGALDTTPVDRAARHHLAAMLFAGVTGVRSAGDPLELAQALHAAVDKQGHLGSEVFVFSPLFTCQEGFGTRGLERMAPIYRAMAEKESFRVPGSAEEAAAEVRKLRAAGVAGITVAFAAPEGAPGRRLDAAILRAIGTEAAALELPLVAIVANAAEVELALESGARAIELAAAPEPLPQALLERMRERNVSLIPRLAAAEGLAALAAGRTEVLDRSLLQQAVPKWFLDQTREAIAGHPRHPAAGDGAVRRRILAAAAAAGVPLVAASAAGSPLVFHGPGLHRELQLWVEAGVAPLQALEAATRRAAWLVGADRRAGLIREGFEANLLAVNGNPLESIQTTEQISQVFFRGEQIDRGELLMEQ